MKANIVHGVTEQRERLWLLAASPAIWAAHFMLCYVTAALWCGMVAGPTGTIEPASIAIALYTLVALAGIGAIGIAGFRRHRSGSTPPHDADSAEDRHRFIGFSTFLLSGLSAIAVCYAALTIAFIDGCQ
jgi:hypothetical protein